MKLDKIIKEMTLDEKIGQLSQNLLGWKTFSDNGKKWTKYLEDELDKYGTIGSMYGMLRSDPWSGVNFQNGIMPSEASHILDKLSDKLAGKTNVYPFLVEEAPHGHQGLDGTCYPVNLAIGCTFNPDLYEKASSCVAKELYYKGANIALLSALDLALDPRWGRTEECYGEDTYLAKIMLRHAVRGMQGKEDKIPKDKVGVVVKHFIGQGSALGGHNGRTVSIGPNELRNSHLPIMEEAIQENAIGTMAAYNDLDGMPCHANKELLVDILRDEMGFKGFVMSDGCAIDNFKTFVQTDEEAIARAFKSGVNMDLWNVTFNSLKKAVESKLISEDRLDESLEIILKSKDRLGLLESKREIQKYEELNKNDHEEINLEIAKESIVLLKNEILPLKNLNKTCLIGPLTENIYHLLGDYTAFQDTHHKNLKEVFNIPSSLGSKVQSEDNGLLNDAIELAKNSENVIMVLGSSSARDFNVKFDSNGAAIIDHNKENSMDCGEGVDRAEVAINKAQQNLFDQVYKINKNIIVIVIAGRPIGIEEISKKAKAVLYSFYGGTKQPQALLDTIIGKNNPSGKLSISVPRNSAQLPVYYWMKETSSYVDQTEKPLYEFGQGLSYSTFNKEISNVEDFGNSKYKVELIIKNTSKIPGKETMMLFAKIKGSIIKPPAKQLVWFKKLEVMPGESKKIVAEVDVEWLHKNYSFNEIDFFVK